MHDEFRATLARQGITEEAYLKAVDKTDADLHAEFRPGAEKRVRTLLVLSKVADAEGLRSPTPTSTPRSPAVASATPDDAKLQAYFDSRARPVVHPQHAPPQPGRRDASSTAGSPTIPSISRCRISRTCRRRPIEGDDRPSANASRRRDRSRLSPRRRPPRRPADRHDPCPRRTRETTNARPHGHRVLQPGGARLRHLLAPAARADHLPRRRDRGPPRQPGHRPAAVPRIRGSGEGHQPVHQLARRPGHVRPRDLRHDAVPARAGQHDLHRHGRVDGGGPAGGRAPRASATPCRTAGS